MRRIFYRAYRLSVTGRLGDTHDPIKYYKLENSIKYKLEEILLREKEQRTPHVPISREARLNVGLAV